MAGTPRTPAMIRLTERRDGARLSAVNDPPALFSRRPRRFPIASLLGLSCLAIVVLASGQADGPHRTTTAPVAKAVDATAALAAEKSPNGESVAGDSVSDAQGAPLSSPAAAGQADSTSRSPRDFFGGWALLPALVAIVLAIASRQVVPSLSLGILTAAVMMCIHGGSYNPLAMIQYALEHYLLGVFVPVDPTDMKARGEGFNHLRVIVFTQFIGGMIGIVEANGGTRAMVARVLHLMRTRRRGQLGALGGGLLIFFDDYANALILGPAMRPVFDRLRLSREKLAYIVDSTAAPVASVFIGTWLAAEISYLDGALGGLASRPAFLEEMTGSAAFWGSLPYRTYAWLALFMVLIIGWTGRDFGPMRKCESLSAAGGSTKGPTHNAEPAPDGRHWYLGFVPVALLVVLTVTLLIITGRHACDAKGMALTFGSVTEITESLGNILGEADSYTALLYAGLTAVTIAAALSVATRRLTFARTIDGMTDGMARIFRAQIVLILAWGLSSATTHLQLGEVASAFLQDKVDRQLFEVQLLPVAVFLTACFVSFSTGTSWGTMGILCPTIIAIAAHLFAPLPAEQAMTLFYGSVGAVLTGAVFGDHCSPISDTTVLSSLATECDLTAHVRTQLPYALVTAVVGLLCTDGLDYLLRTYREDFFNRYWNVYYGTALGALLLFIIVYMFGRQPKGWVGEPAAEPGV
jgi:Na+/H+ antiporter NhaC